MATLFDIRPFGKPEIALNPQQRSAVEHGEGPLLVVAGAGTGKTRVITERIRHLLEAKSELAGENILGLTFTDKAAAEMKRRVVAAAGERAKGVTLSTFHAFCHTLLAAADPSVQVLENVDHWILLRRNMSRLRLERYRRLAEPGQFLGDFVEFFSRCQDELVTPEDYQQFAEELARRFEKEKHGIEENVRTDREEEIARQREIARAYRASEALLNEKKLLTFGSLLADTVRMLRNNTGARRQFQERYRYILVDEFQDTNVAQLELLWLLAGEQRNIVAVGDDDQAIYRFRGASFGSFKIFLEKFAGHAADKKNITRHSVSLTLNYRSTARVLRVAGQVIAQNTRDEMFPPKLLQSQKEEGKKISIAEFETPEQEAHWVSGEIERQHSSGRRWSRFAVLYRMHSHRDQIVEELSRRKIPFLIKNLSILGNRMVRDVLAYLRLVAHPSDNVACARVLAAPAWEFDPRDLMRLCERAAKSRRISLYDALQAPQGELAFAGARKTGELTAFLTRLRVTMTQRATTELLSDLAGWLELTRTASPADGKYLERFREFVRAWEAKSETKMLPEFLEYLDFFEQANGQVNLEEDIPGDAVQLMTVHAAKGLEFPHVFVLRLSKGGFPANARPRVLEFPVALMKEELPEGDFHIQEERRLFYVALTRAEEDLTLTFVHNKRTKPSPFLDDIWSHPQIQQRDVKQLAPKVPARETAVASEPPLADARSSLFPAASELPRAGSRIAQWAKRFHPAAGEPLQLSASAIETYRSCPQKYLFSRVWGIREGPRAATSFGSVMHTTIKHFIGELRKGNRLPYEEVAGIFEREWTSAGFEDDYQEAEYRRDGLEQLRAFHAGMISAPPAVLEQEKTFTLPLDHRTVITGRMDQINSVSGAGRGVKEKVEIVDYKTGRPRSESAAKKDLQLSIYALAAREVLELDPVRLVFHYLQDNQTLVTTREDKQLKEAEGIIQEVAADIRAGEFGAKPGFACKSCGYRPICPAHEQVVAVLPSGS
ncbi:MAG TPA: ATP-dependent DNA helicase [Candidatus Acidoferrales bacterium]|nr:ATP-dependent DNA helicase [Candidatus Acidoferrales bacterium]